MDAVQLEQDFIGFLGGGNLAKLIAAALLIITIAVVTHLAVKWLKRIMNKEDSRIPQSSFLINLLRFVFWGVGLSFIMNACFGVDMNALVAALGVGGIAISLGAQETIANFIGGILIVFQGLIKVGDNIRVGSNKGVVQDIAWRHTTIKNSLGETVIIPNSVISKNAVVLLPAVEKVIVHFYVTTPRDLAVLAKEVEERTHKVADHLAEVAIDPKVYFTEIGETGTKGKVVVTIDDADMAVDVADAVTRAIAPLVCEAQSHVSEEESKLGEELFKLRIENDIEQTARLKAAKVAAALAAEQELETISQ
ncbi:MAG: mechanosensitive ion channel family protein [Anaerotardibacter sp.]